MYECVRGFTHSAGSSRELCFKMRRKLIILPPHILGYSVSLTPKIRRKKEEINYLIVNGCQRLRKKKALAGIRTTNYLN